MVKLNKIYTRTGDDGTTGLVDGTRRAKHDARMEAIGAVDEANSAIGLAVVALEGGPHAAVLTRIQNDLFDLGADLATPGEDFAPSEMVLRIVPAQAEWLEGRIDARGGAERISERRRVNFAPRPPGPDGGRGSPFTP